MRLKRIHCEESTNITISFNFLYMKNILPVRVDRRRQVFASACQSSGQTVAAGTPGHVEQRQRVLL